MSADVLGCPVIWGYFEVLSMSIDNMKHISVKGTIIELFFTLFKGHYIVASICAAIVLYAAGLFVSYQIDFASDYISTLPVYLGVFGIAWVGCWLGWGTRRLYKIFKDVRLAFIVSDETYRNTVDAWHARLFHWPMQFLFSILGVLISWSMVYIFSRNG